MAMRDGFDAMARDLAEMGPAYPEAAVALVDALRDYIRACEADMNDAAQEGGVTSEQWREWQADLDQFRKILKDVEAAEVNPCLDGLIPWKATE